MWKSEIDFENDLEEFSEIEVIRNDYDVTTPQSLVDWEASNGINNHRSVFDVPDFTEDVTYIVSGRGRGGRSTIIRPGVPTTGANTENDIKKLIRQVSGPGYSNELIEQYLVRNKDTKRNYMPSCPEIEVSSHSSSTSGRSTPNYVTSGSISLLDSPKRSTGAVPKKTSPSATSLSASSSVSCISPESEIVEEEKSSEPAAPLPLSEILRRAKDEAKRKTQEKNAVENKTVENCRMAAKNNSESKENNQADGNQNDYWWGNAGDSRDDPSNMWRRRDGPIKNKFFGVQGRNFNIKSQQDFPSLK